MNKTFGPSIHFWHCLPETFAHGVIKTVLCSWLTFLFIAAGITSVFAQPHIYPVAVTPQMIVGGSVYIGDFASPMATANKLNFTLTLQDPLETERTVYFRLSIVQNGTILASNPVGFRGHQITLQKDIPYHINGEDLAENLNINNLSGLNGPNQYGVLNEGITDICIEVIDAFREEPISRRVCATGYLARLQAPILILPVENQNIFEAQLNNLVFTWQMTDPLAHLPLANINYFFELREKSALLDPQDQFENHTLIYSATVEQFSIFYNELSSQLDPGKSYIWRITAQFFDQVGNKFPDYFVNQGISRIGVFHVLPDLGINSEDSGISCLCPVDECDMIFPDITQAARNLLPGDSIKFGAFYLKIAELDGNGSSGKGSIKIPFMNTSLSVGFDNININDKFEVTHGQVSTLASQILDGIGIDADNLPDLSDLPVGGTWLNQMHEHVSMIKESMALPLSLGNKLALVGFDMPFEVFITDVEFNVNGAATMNLLLSIPGSDNQLYNFGATGVNIGRNGFDMANLKLFLLNDISIPGLANIPLTIRKAVFDDPGVGSYITFGCEGFEQFNLQCRYQFPADQLLNAEDEDQPVIADIILRSDTWGQFMGYGSMPDFTISGAPGWKFSTEQVVMDLHQFANPEEIQFPESYSATTETWKGFYIQNISVTFPEDISLTEEGSTEFSANHVIIDNAGITCQAIGSNILSISTGNVGGWAFSLDTVLLNIFQNNFIDAHVTGQIGIEVLHAELNYQGLLLKDIQNNYHFNLSPLGTFEIPYLMLQAEIETGSVLVIEKQPITNKYKPYVDLNLGLQLLVEEEDFRSTGLGEAIDKLKALFSANDFQLGMTDLHFKNLMVNHPSLPPGKRFGLGSVEGGVIHIPGAPDMQLSDLMLLEQDAIFDNITLPALGLDVRMNMGLISLGVGVWAKEDTTKPNGGYSFGKLELNLPDFSGMSFRCSCDSDSTAIIDFCIPPNLAGGTPSTIQVDDKIYTGHFAMRVEEMTGPGQGKGKIEIPFLRILMDVEFENLSVHKMPDGRKQVVSGIVNTTANALLGDYEVEVTEVEGPLNLSGLSITQEFMNQLDNMSNMAGEFFTMPMSLSDKMETLFDVRLPEGFDFILLGLKFEPTGARLSSMLTLKMPGENYMKFGLSGLQVRPDGFNLDGIQIYLAEDFTISN